MYGAAVIYSILCCVLANMFLVLKAAPWVLVLIIPAYLFILLLAGLFAVPAESKRLRLCYHGAVLLISFRNSMLCSLIWQGMLAFALLPEQPWVLLWSVLFCAGLEYLLFWCGILCVYFTSVQLGVKLRLIGLIFGMVPIVNLLVLNKMIRTVFREVRTEYEKEVLNKSRVDQKLCQTKYPILMVHGVFFRDSRYFNYWGRIPQELERNGASVYYGNHQSAASIEESAAELAQRIKSLVTELGCEKVNIIAHSKGGLDCRYALEALDVAPFVASLTTINTPHRGCIFADHLLTVISPKVREQVASAYNRTLKKLGDSSPDFLAAVTQLTASYCDEFNPKTPLPEGVYCQSVGSVLSKARGGKFPLNFSYHIVRHYDGENDGLVGERSFSWGERYICLRSKSRRGISHGDMIDLNRENFDGFDVREFYVNLVNDLKVKGL
jgi:triacylglycerol lipase